MPEYYLDEEWNMVKAPITTQDLASWANFFQKKYFPDVEADVQVGINTNSKFHCYCQQSFLLLSRRQSGVKCCRQFGTSFAWY
jgi:hypothetical protein